MQAIISAIAEQYSLKKNGGRYIGACPECGGSANSDRFRLYADGGFRCFSCGFKGDIITWLRKKEGKSCPDAHEYAGIPCRAASCHVRGTCRLGDGSGKRAMRQPRSCKPLEQPGQSGLPLTSVKSPKALWRTWAEELAEKAMAELMTNQKALDWLASRGISAAAADRFGLGWLGHDRKVKRDAIGLPPKDGKPELWVPGGLVVAIWDENTIHRLRIRRTDEDRGRFLPALKYVWLEGSGTEPLIIRPAGKIRGAVIVESELDAYAVAAAHDQVMVIALGTVGAGLPPELRREVALIPTILVALDADSDQGNKPNSGAGPAAVKKWLATFRQARFWPVPNGKDPGEYAQHGGNIRAWIETGLIPELTAIATGKKHDLPLSPESFSAGEGGSGFIAAVVPAAIPGKSDLPEKVPGLKWCSICGGDKFLHGSAGGYFCIECQPVGKPGRLVLATVPRGAYVVD